MTAARYIIDSDFEIMNFVIDIETITSCSSQTELNFKNSINTVERVYHTQRSSKKTTQGVIKSSGVFYYLKKEHIKRNTKSDLCLWGGCTSGFLYFVKKRSAVLCVRVVVEILLFATVCKSPSIPVILLARASQPFKEEERTFFSLRRFIGHRIKTLGLCPFLIIILLSATLSLLSTHLRCVYT